MKVKIKILNLIFVLLLMVVGFQILTVKAMPFYDLNPHEIVLRSKFYTTYSKSTEERKNNIALAAKALDNTFLDVGGEFSFNKTIGQRTIEKGYMPAKIIFNGKFVFGVGGGVCQVSTTLYNAFLLAGLDVTECHPHSLAVNYVAPSFDAMVNSGSADLRCVNNTDNPIVIKAVANGDIICIEIYGEPMSFAVKRQSEVIGEIVAPKEEIIEDSLNEYPELFEGETKVITYSKNGIVSRGYLIVTKNGKTYKKIIRNDKYGAVKGLIVKGVNKREVSDNFIILKNKLSKNL